MRPLSDIISHDGGGDGDGNGDGDDGGGDGVIDGASDGDGCVGWPEDYGNSAVGCLS